MTDKKSHVEKHANKIKTKNAAEKKVEEKLDNNEVEALKSKITDLEAVINDQNNKNLRSLAEIENLRRRSTEEVHKASKYAISKFASELVLVAENLNLAVDNLPEEEVKKDKKINNFAQGVVMTQKELIKIFEKYGIKRINPLNEEFDHNFHEAIARVESEGESGIVTKVIQAGYTIQDRLIRPALVEVSA